MYLIVPSAIVLLAFESTSDHACNDIHLGLLLWNFGDVIKSLLYNFNDLTDRQMALKSSMINDENIYQLSEVQRPSQLSDSLKKVFLDLKHCMIDL